ESTTTSDIRPTKAEYKSSWWIRSQLFFRQHVPKAPVVQHHSLRPKKWIKDEVISQLNLCVFKLETIIQVLTRERKNEYGLLQFKDEFSILGHYLVEKELRLCLEAKERMRLEHKKNIIEEQRFRVEEAKRMKLEEEKLLKISDIPGKTKATVSWVKINKHRLNVNDPSLAELLKKVKTWVEDLSRLFHSLDIVWLTPDIQRFISREGKIKCKFLWSDDYTVGRNFWLTLVCLDPTRKGWLSEEHGRHDNANWAMSDVDQRREQMIEMQPFLHLSTVLAESYNLLKELQDYELEKCKDLMKSINETQLKERLPGILGATKVFEKKGIDPTDYSIRFKLADHVPKQGVAMAYSASSGSSKKVVPKYVKFMVLEKISECKRTINFIVGEVQNATSHLEHLNGMIEMLEGMHFTLEIYDSVWCLREMVKSENKKLNDLNKQLLDAEEDIRDFVDENMTDDMPVLDEVVFKIHKNGYFELDPLRYVNGSFSSVSAFTCDRDIFPSCLNWILSSIPENIWALFYCLPNTPLEKGLKLIHTDNDVLSFFAEAERRGKIHLYVTHKQQALGKFYLKNMVWLEEDASLRCSSSSPFSTRIKRKSHKTTKDCGRKNSRGKEKMVDDEPLGRKLLKTSRTGKEKMDELDEFPDLTPTKEREVDDDVVGRNSIRTRRKGKEIMAEFSCTPANEKKVVVNNYRRALINGKYRMVEVADVGLVEDELNLLNKKDLGKKTCWISNRCSGILCQGEGLTIIKDDSDMEKLYAIAEKYGLVNFYIAHIPENLAEYYFKNLTLDASDEEAKSKIKSHEKRKLDASAMSPHELFEWAEQEAGSPYLRTPPIKPRRKGIEFPCKNLFADFLHCDSVADEIVLHDNWKYEGLSLDGHIDVEGPTTWCDLVHECVVENGHSLPIMDKECFTNNVVLDDVVHANRKSMPLLLMKKGRNNNFRLRRGCGKRVACGANTRRLGGLMGLNVHVVDEVSQVTKQGPLSAGSSNTDDKDLGSLSAGSSNTADKDLEKSY
ncbi:hypothetical protein Tco_0742743, partial [Tanacetum coccineum]